jgi:hypothetical protein
MKMDLNIVYDCELDSAGSGQDTVAGSYENDNEISGSIRMGNLLVR